jgi:hypothetical protein
VGYTQQETPPDERVGQTWARSGDPIGTKSPRGERGLASIQSQQSPKNQSDSLVHVGSLNEGRVLLGREAVAQVSDLEFPERLVASPGRVWMRARATRAQPPFGPFSRLAGINGKKRELSTAIVEHTSCPAQCRPETQTAHCQQPLHAAARLAEIQWAPGVSAARCGTKVREASALAYAV